jgi:hypothetical protein
MPNNIKSGFFINGILLQIFRSIDNEAFFYCNAQLSILTTKYKGTELQSTS